MTGKESALEAQYAEVAGQMLVSSRCKCHSALACNSVAYLFQPLPSAAPVFLNNDDDTQLFL